MSKAIELNAAKFDEEVMRASLPVLVDFWAPWCMPCQMMAPVLDEMAEELDGKIKIAKVDVENPENQDLALKYNIRSIPNIKLFKGGEVVEEFMGFRPKEIFVKEIEQLL